MASGEKKKLVVFDFDGVILDSLAEHKRRYDHVYSLFGKRNPAKTLSEWKKWHDSKWERNFTRLGIKESQLDLAIARYWRGFEYKTSKPFSGVKRVLQTLSEKYGLAIVSNTRASIVAKALSKFGLRKFFAVIEGGNHKSGKAKRLREALRKSKTAKENAVIIGDTPADVRAGKELGVKTIGVLYGWSERKRISGEKPDGLVRKSREIPLLVKRIFGD
ncbi:MAG: HAD family hydrolase [Candidatus Norongarragalinales archaeon]